MTKQTPKRNAATNQNKMLQQIATKYCNKSRQNVATNQYKMFQQIRTKCSNKLVQNIQSKIGDKLVSQHSSWERYKNGVLQQRHYSRLFITTAESLRIML